MSQTRNQTTTTGPDVASGQYLGDARAAATAAYNATLSAPTYTGDRSAGLNPLQEQGANYAGQIASLFGPAAQNLMGQSQGYGNANQYFNAQQNAGYGGLQQQSNMLGGGYGAQNFLQSGQQAGYNGLNTVSQANGLFGQGAQGQRQQAAQLDPYLQASQGLLNTNAVNGLDQRIGAGDAAQNGIRQYGQNAAAAGYNAATGALNGAPDVSAFMNPYRQQVLDATKEQFGQVRDATNRNISDRATAAGAFGGSREAVTRGAALADIARNETAQLAGLTSQGYSDAMNRAMQQQQFQSQAGQSLFGQGLGALGQQAGSGDAALNARLGLYGQGLNNLGQAGMQGSNSLFNSGMGAGQYLAGYGQQNANTLYGGANAAGQFLGTQGSYGANQQGQFGADANRQLFGAGVQGADSLGQYGTLFQNVAQQGIDRNVAATQDPITRQQQALGLLFQGVNGGGQTSTTPLYQNGVGNALGYASAGLGLYNQFRNTFGGNGGGGNYGGTGYGGSAPPIDNFGGGYKPTYNTFGGG